MGLRRRIRIGIALAAALPAVAHAELDGRVQLTNIYTQVTGPDASFDATLLRIWLRQDRIGGRKLSFVVDSRNDFSVLASAKDAFERGSVFNEQCRGDAESIAHPGCADVPVREQRTGQLLHLAGIYDAYVMLGELSAGHMAYSIGRKTLYEAGLTTVDGVTVERQMYRSRFGVFGGLAPDPLTRMFSAQHQTAGGYFAFQHDRAWVRLGAVAQLYEAQPDRVTIHNHDFWSITSSMRLAAMLQFDVVPAPQERLVQLDLTVRPSGRYRLRGSLMRFRPYDYAFSPSHLIQPPEDALIDDFRSATQGDGTTPSALRGRYDYKEPEVLESELRTSAINQVKLVGHYSTSSSLIPFVSAAFRTREIDGAGALLLGGGVYAYDFMNLGIVGRVRLDHNAGFTSDSDRVTIDIEQRLNDSLAFGGGILFGTVKYHGREEVVNAGYPETTAITGASVRVRNDQMDGLSLFGQIDYQTEGRDMGTQTPNAREADEVSTSITASLGASWRF